MTKQKDQKTHQELIDQVEALTQRLDKLQMWNIKLNDRISRIEAAPARTYLKKDKRDIGHSSDAPGYKGGPFFDGCGWVIP